MSETKGFKVGVDFQRILDTIASRIYDNHFAFLRENVQNAIDAVRIQAIRDSRPVDADYRVDINIDGTTCQIRDTGNGMTKDELETHFWTMGASGKNTEEARQAGCIGTFGIGGFANFGVCNKLTVISRTTKCKSAHKTSLARSDFDKTPGELPTVHYQESDQINDHGTIVIGESDDAFDEAGLLEYIKQFVAHVREPVYFNGQRISQKGIFDIGENYEEVTDILEEQSGEFFIKFQLFKDEGHNLAAQLLDAKIGGVPIECNGFVRLVNGAVRVFKRGFKLCDVSINSRIGISGTFDSDLAKPTAGRDSLNAQSLSQITQLFRIIESKARDLVVRNEELLASHVRLLPDILAAGELSKLNLLRVSTLDGESYLLSEIQQLASEKRVFYSLSNQKTTAAEVIQAKGDLIVSVSGDRGRRRAEVQYLDQLCNASVFDNLIERLEPYTELDDFERTLLAELEIAIKKLFKPHSFIFLPGRLTLDVPIFWSNKKENGKTIVYVDTRHGEFQKLQPLGYSPLLWSMIEAFCREYLGDTLRKISTKFFGSGAINLEAYAKSHAELWELVSSEIETSMLESPREQGTRSTHSLGRIEIVRSQDITHVQISTDEEQPTAHDQTIDQEEDKQPPGKLLHIVDNTGNTGLAGYYIRIPISASNAFGEIIRTFSNYAVLWFANRITWSGSDNVDTAFLYHITLDQMIGGPIEPHGAMDLDSLRLQNYKGQIYFYILPEFESYLVPADDVTAIKVSVTHELVDLGRSRAWTSREVATK